MCLESLTAICNEASDGVNLTATPKEAHVQVVFHTSPLRSLAAYCVEGTNRPQEATFLSSRTPYPKGAVHEVSCRRSYIRTFTAFLD